MSENIEASRIYNLPVAFIEDFGVYVDAQNLGDILVPKRYVPEETEVGTELSVFIYHDSEGRLIATTQRPKIKVGECDLVEIVDVNKTGAFADIGLQKDLLIPYDEQKFELKARFKTLVYAYYDRASGRIVGSTFLERHLSKFAPVFEEGDEVDILVGNKIDLGYVVVVEGTHLGLVYHNETFKPLLRGYRTKGYVKSIREDYRIDIMLHKPGFEKVDELEDLILQSLKYNGGFIELGDKSPAEDIYESFSVSKKTFKKALGALYKRRLVKLEPQRTTLLKKE